MKCFFLFCVLLVAAANIADGQDFITRGKIEFEIKHNNKAMYRDENLTNNPFVATLPAFDISYRDLLFAWNKSIYQAGRKSATSGYNNDNAVYTDLDKHQCVRKQMQLQEEYVYADSVRKVKWKIQNETRKIAGFTCRKAIGRIYDSIYVVAFYCPEIIPQGGPEFFSGLPGMILGLAIPRYYTTWFATKIELADIDESKIVPPAVKKAKQYSVKELSEIIYKKLNAVNPAMTMDKIKEILKDYRL